MEQHQRFVTFNLDGFNHVDQMVNTLLGETITHMNKIACITPERYSKMSGGDVEILSLQSL